MKNVQISDKNGAVIGHAPIKEAIEKELVRRVVRVLVFNNNRELFLQLRAPDSKSFPSHWDVSAGGHVDVGETDDHAAVRELAEEIGITGVPLEKIDRYYFEEEEKGKFLASYDILYKTTCEEVSIDNDEVTGGRWISLEDLESELDEGVIKFTPGVRYIFREYLKIGNRK